VRGPGETKLEIDRRRVRYRIAELKEDIEEVRKQRTIYRRQRAGQAMPVIAVVGYTNAGKSSLFNALTAADVLAENKLFATLDPVTRHIVLSGNQEALLTDTVGFIQKLPTKLIAAFRATLEEVIEADILLEVVDASHENAIEQSETVNEILEELGKPRVTALNKIDLLNEPDVLDTSLYLNAVPVSALQQKGLDALREKIVEVLANNMDTIPTAGMRLVDKVSNVVCSGIHNAELVSVRRLPNAMKGRCSSSCQNRSRRQGISHYVFAFVQPAKIIYMAVSKISS